MEEIKKTEESKSKKDITNKWLELVYNHLETLNNLERLARNGCQGIMEYVNIPKNQFQGLTMIQIKNLNLLISEFEMTFENVKEVISELELQAMIEKLKKIKNIRGSGIKGIPYYKQVGEVVNKIQKTKIQLTPTFYILVNLLSELRGDLVTSLKHILWIREDGEPQLTNQGEY